MRRLLGALGALFLALPSLAALADEEALRKAMSAYVDAFNARDLEATAALWGAKAEHLDEDTGERTEGREAIVADVERGFEASPDAKLVAEIQSIRMTTPEVAVVTGRSIVETADADPVVSNFKAVFVSQDGVWRIDSVAERGEAAPSPASPLDELSWLVGTWVDETEDVRIVTSFRWTDDGAFLLRSFDCVIDDAVDKRGTQIIGWDPRAGHIRSWTFESDGAFGDAVWSRSGDEWIVRSTQTLADGRAASGTFVLGRVDDDTATLRLIGHEIEGEPLPAREPVTMRRAAPETVEIDASPTEGTPPSETPEGRPAPVPAPGTSEAPQSVPGAALTPTPPPAPSTTTPPSTTPVLPATPKPAAPRTTPPAPASPDEGAQR